MASTTPGPTPERAERPHADPPASAGVTADAEQYLAARLARWLADVAVTSATDSADEELDDAA